MTPAQTFLPRRTEYLPESVFNSFIISVLQPLYAVISRYLPAVYLANFANWNRGGKLVVTICHHPYC